jgi:DUF1680 family protein
MSDTTVALGRAGARGGADAWGRPVAPAAGLWRPVGIGDVRITGGFWADRQRLNGTAIIQHCERWVETMGWTGNFDAAVEGRLPGDRRGREFSDSDVYKLIEAMAWEIGRTGDEGMDRRLRALVDRIARVQEPDGYLNTMFGRPGQADRYSDLQWGHELYCFGHLIQAAIARGRTHGDDLLVEVATRAADHVCETFGPDGIASVDGHPEIELALAELARHTGEKRYLDQARLFVERRGHGILGDIEFGAAYYQDDVPVRDADVLRGHAVRALYLAAGAADVAVDTGDDELLAAVSRQTLHTLARRTYLTGGMGAHHEGESFGLDFELPPDRAYSETCAGVAAVMLGHRLLLATGDPTYADAVERTLFNVVATSPAADGQSFFYTNTLYHRVPGEVPDPEVASPRASSDLRAPWFNVSCCPTNVARTFATLGAYVASVDDEGIQLHQYAPSEITTTLADGAPLSLRLETRYPADGTVRLVVVEAPARPWALTLRVPAWASGATVRSADGQHRADPGYVTVRREFRAGDVVELDLPVTPRWTRPHPRIDAVRGAVAVERGPVVMCLESVDLGCPVDDVRVDPSVPPRDCAGTPHVVAGTASVGEPAWPYGPPGEVEAPALREVALVPYHSWGNRGPSTMRVWLPVVEDGPERTQ